MLTEKKSQPRITKQSESDLDIMRGQAIESVRKKNELKEKHIHDYG